MADLLHSKRWTKFVAHVTIFTNVSSKDRPGVTEMAREDEPGRGPLIGAGIVVLVPGAGVLLAAAQFGAARLLLLSLLPIYALCALCFLFFMILGGAFLKRLATFSVAMAVAVVLACSLSAIYRGILAEEKRIDPGVEVRPVGIFDLSGWTGRHCPYGAGR